MWPSRSASPLMVIKLPPTCAFSVKSRELPFDVMFLPPPPSMALLCAVTDLFQPHSRTERAEKKRRQHQRAPADRDLIQCASPGTHAAPQRPVPPRRKSSKGESPDPRRHVPTARAEQPRGHGLVVFGQGCSQHGGLAFERVK